jgi:parvulin-like peptidyl-prolyl isomerase
MFMSRKSPFVASALVGAMLALLSFTASAQHDRPYGRSPTPHIDRVQAEQAQRIAFGVRRGALTRAEARVLQREQEQIARVKERALRDGRVSGAERQRLHALQAQAAQHIAMQLRDADRARGRHG